jgi:hypothetical protein
MDHPPFALIRAEEWMRAKDYALFHAIFKKTLGDM